MKEDEAALINSYKNSLTKSSDKIFVEKLDKKNKGKSEVKEKEKSLHELMMEAARESGLPSNNYKSLSPNKSLKWQDQRNDAAIRKEEDKI